MGGNVVAIAVGGVLAPDAVMPKSFLAAATGFSYVLSTFLSHPLRKPLILFRSSSGLNCRVSKDIVLESDIAMLQVNYRGVDTAMLFWARLRAKFC